MSDEKEYAKVSWGTVAARRPPEYVSKHPELNHLSVQQAENLMASLAISLGGSWRNHTGAYRDYVVTVQGATVTGSAVDILPWLMHRARDVIYAAREMKKALKKARLK